MQPTVVHHDLTAPSLDALVIEVCAEELWDGVYCVLPPGHTGSHVSAASHGGCSFTWRSPTAPAAEETPTAGASLDSFLRLMRAGTQR